MWRWLVPLLCLCQAARAEPMHFELARELDRALYVVRATVVRAPSPANLVELRVGATPSSVHRGFDRLGKSLLVRCYTAGSQSMHAYLRERIGRALLVVVDANREIRVLAERRETGWRFRGFYDFNAVTVGYQKRAGASLLLPFEAVSRRFDGRHSPIHRAAVLLLIPPARRSTAAAERLIARLADPRYRERQQASARLDEIAVFHQALLRERMRTTRLLEVRRRLRATLEQAAPWRAAARLATQAGEDPALAALLLRRAMRVLSAPRRLLARRELERLKR